MTIPTIKVQGTALPPDAEGVGGTVRFVLSGFDIDGPTSAVVPREVQAAIENDGTFEADVWPTSRGMNDRSYSVFVNMPRAAPGVGRFETFLGNVLLDESAPVQLIGDLIVGAEGPDSIILNFNDWWTALGNSPQVFSVADGIAETDPDEYFVLVTGGGQQLELWQNVDGSPVPIRVQIEEA